MKKILFFLFLIPFKAYATNVVGPIFPSTCSNVAYNSSSDWVNPSSGTIEDGLLATSTHTSTDYLYCSGYNFIIPPNAIITGIVLGVRKIDILQNGMVDQSVRLFQLGAPVGNDKADGFNDWPFSLTYINYGSSNDLWGLSNVTPTTFNDPLFGAGFSGIKSSGGGTSSGVDAEQMTVYFNLATTINNGTINNGVLQ